MTIYRQCTRCVMDTSDPEISFDGEGRCNHCRGFEKLRGTSWFPDEQGQQRLDEQLEQVRRAGSGHEFDCVLGLSGGVDSSFLALRAREWGLRTLLVHVDAGWNSELAVQNIQRVVDHTGFELHTQVINWSDMRNLQLSYLRSGVANQDVPQDHAYFASLYHFATENRIRYVLNGHNIATEGIYPIAWQGRAMDARNLLAIHRQFGTEPLRDYPTIKFSTYYFLYPVVRRMRPLHPLNFLAYDKKAAIEELQEEAGWRAYGRKHGESIFTKFFQNHYLPTRFGYDKRLPHLSSRIMAGEISRSDALRELEEPLYDPDELVRDIAYFCRKLRITEEEFNALMKVTKHDWTDFPSSYSAYTKLKRAQGWVSAASGRKLNVYG